MRVFDVIPPKKSPVTALPKTKLSARDSTDHPIMPKVDKKQPGRRIKIRTILLALGLIVLIGLAAIGLVEPLIDKPHITAVLYVLVAIIFKIKSRISFVIALFLLLAIPILLLIDRRALAETYAIFCFYFLVVGITMAFFELRTSVK